MKRCPRCSATKPLSAFRRKPSRPSGVEDYCRPCSNAYQKEWRAKSNYRDYANTRQRRGTTQKEVDALLAAQGGGCAICGVPVPGGIGGWHLDHDHATGNNRGVLCARCNWGLGNFKDSPDVLSKAVAYLRRHA